MIYAFMADGFEEIEALTPIDMLLRLGFDVKMVGVTGEIVSSARGLRIITDIPLSQIDMSKAEMILLPGGMPGTEHLRQSKEVQYAISYCIEHDIWIGAICAAPSILAGMGFLDGKKVSCYPSVEDTMQHAKLSMDPVSIDGKIITSRGAGTALPFAIQLCEVLKGKHAAEELMCSICYQ